MRLYSSALPSSLPCDEWLSVGRLYNDEGPRGGRVESRKLLPSFSSLTGRWGADESAFERANRPELVPGGRWGGGSPGWGKLTPGGCVCGRPCWCSCC